MKFTALDSSTGQVLYGGEAESPSSLASSSVTIFTGQSFTEGWVDAGVHYSQPARPSMNHTFDWVSKSWVDQRSLAQVKAAKRAEIKAAKEAADLAPVSTAYGSFDANLISRAKLGSAIQALLTATTRTQVVFTLSDNSRAQLSPGQIREVGVALFDRDDANAASAAFLRGAIDAATSTAEVQAIHWG